MNQKEPLLKKSQFFKIKTVSKIIILIFLLQLAFTGCIPSSKYLVSKEPVIISEEELSSWTELEGEIIDINSENVIINLKERDYKNIKEKKSYYLQYKYAFIKRRDKNQFSSIPITSSEKRNLLLSELAIIAGTGLGVNLALNGAFDAEEEDENAQYIIGGKDFGRAFVASLIAAIGLGYFYMTINKKTSGSTPIETRQKIISDKEKSLINKPVDVWIKNCDFKKEYSTNFEGNISIKKVDLLPFFPYKGSTVNLNVSYENKITQIWVSDKFIKE
jgi:hypothetical protein